MKNCKKLLLTLTNGLKSSTEKKFFWPKLEKNLFKNRLSIRVRNFASSLGRYVFGSEISYNKAPPRLPGLGC